LNCVIANNHADGGGGGVHVAGSILSDVRIVNCTIADNTAEESGGAVVGNTSVDILNSVLWGNSPTEIVGGAIRVEYSDVRGGWTGEGNLDLPPNFVEKQGYTHLLHPSSPCIDTGDPAIEDGVWDDHPRWPENYPNRARSDMGAYGGPANRGWWRMP